MKRAVALSLLVALPSVAQDPVDPPIDEEKILVPKRVIVDSAKRIVSLEAERDTYKAAVPVIHPALLAVIVGVLACGAGVGIGYAAAKK